MKELNTVSFGDDKIAIKDARVVSGIIPKGSSELNRVVAVQGESIFEGPVYGQNIIIENGPALFKGAVYANSELHIESGTTGDIVFEKAVGCGQSLVSLATGARTVFGADINARSVKLRNAFVAGSIFAEEISLEYCVVIGGVFATKKLNLQNSLVGTFNGPEVQAGGINYLMFPSAFSVEPISMLPGTEFYNLSLADLGALYRGQPEKPMTGSIALDIKADGQRTVLVDDKQNTILVTSYSVAGKVLVSSLVDLEKLENNFLLSAAGLGSQLSKVFSLPECEDKPLTTLNLRDFFFEILSGKIKASPLDGSVTFEDIKKVLAN